MAFVLSTLKDSSLDHLTTRFHSLTEFLLADSLNCQSTLTQLYINTFCFVDDTFQTWHKYEKDNQAEQITETPLYQNYTGNGLDMNNNFVLQLNEDVLGVKLAIITNVLL